MSVWISAPKRILHHSGSETVLFWNGCSFAFRICEGKSRGERVLDLGTGTGIIPILMEAKTESEDFTALEIQPESADMARRSVRYNHLEDKIKDCYRGYQRCFQPFGASSFDIITTNPPYMIGNHGHSSANEAKAIARHEVCCTLDDVLRECQTADTREAGFIWCTDRSGWQRSSV